MSNHDESPERQTPRFAVDVVNHFLFKEMFKYETKSHWPERERFLFGIKAWSTWDEVAARNWDPTTMLSCIVVPKEERRKLKKAKDWDDIALPMVRLSNTETTFKKFYIATRPGAPALGFIEPRINRLNGIITAMEEDLKEAKDQLAILETMRKSYE